MLMSFPLTVDCDISAHGSGRASSATWSGLQLSFECVCVYVSSMFWLNKNQIIETLSKFPISPHIRIKVAITP